MALPIPDLDTMEAAEVATDDKLIIDDTSADETKTIEVGKLLGLPSFGWTSAAETWTFSSFSSTTRLGVVGVPSDATTKYSIGMWVKITQSTGGTKYGVITALTSSTLTINFFDSYTLNNETISTPYYSPHKQPFGAPSLPKKYTDANGWTVFDYGTHKRYYGTVSISGSVAQNSRISWSKTIPVGSSSSTVQFSDSYSGDFSGHISTSQELIGSTVNGSISSMYSGGALTSGGIIILWGQDK